MAVNTMPKSPNDPAMPIGTGSRAAKYIRRPDISSTVVEDRIGGVIASASAVTGSELTMTALRPGDTPGATLPAGSLFVPLDGRDVFSIKLWGRRVTTPVSNTGTTADVTIFAVRELVFDSNRTDFVYDLLGRATAVLGSIAVNAPGSPLPTADLSWVTSFTNVVDCTRNQTLRVGNSGALSGIPTLACDFEGAVGLVLIFNNPTSNGSTALSGDTLAIGGMIVDF